MINLQVKYEKNAISNKNKKGTMLLNIGMEQKQVKKNTKRKQLNIALVVDTSFSMDQGLRNNYENFGYNPMILTNRIVANNIVGNQINGLGQEFFQIQQQYIKKLDQAKKMAREIINTLNMGDIFSIIKFDDKATVVQESIVIGNDKSQLLNKINLLKCEGSTNLYDGWEVAAKETAKFMTEKTLNRIILLTDGGVNMGLTNLEEIVNRVGKMTEANIQTTTIGIGNGFQEQLLTKMAERGEGNFFYIEKDEDFEKVLKAELNGLTLAGLTNVELEFESDNVDFEQINQFKELNKKISIPNLRYGNEVKLVCDFNIKKEVKLNKSHSFKLGNVKVSGINIDGKKVTYTEELFIEKVTDAEYENILINGDVKVEKMIMEMALQQEEASKMILQGKSAEARVMMQGSLSALRSVDNANALSMANKIEESLLKNDNEMSKVISASAYSSRYGLDS